MINPFLVLLLTIDLAATHAYPDGQRHDRALVTNELLALPVSYDETCTELSLRQLDKTQCMKINDLFWDLYLL